MKYSNFNVNTNSARKYAKLLCLKSILLIFLFSCQTWKDWRGKREVRKETESQVVDDTAEGEIEGDEKIRTKQNEIVIGAERMNLFVDSLKGKRIAVVGNQTSTINQTHLVDTLLSLGVEVIKVFSPEHGFRGDADAGEKVNSGTDLRTGLPLISLYGNYKKPKAAQLEDVDMVVFDIQDVGVRFYTYISTLHYVMESCAENNIPVIVLDRPNPNAHYIDGPIREEAHKSFVGMHPVPIVYGMTIGEYALMINGEKWLADSVHCDLKVIPLKNYSHKMKYVLPIPPSPNLRSEAAVALYPSLCLFEATTVSVGRGTDRPFEMYGHPRWPEMEFSFTPIASFGAKNPLWENKLCWGFDLHSTAKKRMYDMNLNFLLEAKMLCGDSIDFINQPGFFDRLAGTSELRKQINEGLSAKEIRTSWKPGIQQFRRTRSKYLLYE